MLVASHQRIDFKLSEFGMDTFADVLAHAVGSFGGIGPDAIELPVRTDD